MLKVMQLSASAWALGVALSGQAATAEEVSGGAVAAPAQAGQPAATNGSLEEIVVSARRTNENLQNVPVAITAFSSEQLQQQNARSVADLAMLTPGLQVNYSTSTSGGAIYTLRGQVQQDPIANQDAAVGVYVDGLYWARAYGANADLLDVQSVQVLKGPQGPLFGRNTTGGAVLLGTNDPNFHGLSGSVTGTYGRYNYRSITGVINAPLVADKIALRVAGQLVKRDGYIDDLNNHVKLGNIDNYTVRSKLLLQPTETFSIVLSGEWYRSNTRNEPQRLIYASLTGPTALQAIAQTDGLVAAGTPTEFGGLGCFDPTGPSATCQARAAEILGASIKRNQGNTADLNSIPRSYVKTQTYGGTATLDTSFGAIKAIVGYRKVNSDSFNDNDGSPFFVLDVGNGLGKSPGIYNDHANLWQFSSELVATGTALDHRLDFATGLYYFHERGADASVSEALVTINPTQTGVWYYGRIKNDSKSAFGQVTYHATNALSVTGGLRYSIDDKRLTSFNSAYPFGTVPTFNSPTTFCIVAATCPAYRADTFKGWSYTASVDYKFRDGMLVYLKTAKGFRSGGENIRATSAAGFVPFKPEKAYSYEAGVKSEFLDRRLRMNIAGYYTTLNDIQRTITFASASGSVATGILNAGQAEIYGAEFEANAILPGGFRLDGTVGYTHPRYVRFDDNGFDRRRDAFYGVPKWTASISPSWSNDLDIGKLLVRADFSYQSDMNISPVAFYTDASGVTRDAQNGNVVSAADAAGYLRGATDKAHWLINARAALTVMDGALELAVWGKNLSNQRDYVAGLTLPVLGYSAAGAREPRTFGITGTFKFGAQ
jgi:iron complex outermembrane receptor protein